MSSKDGCDAPSQAQDASTSSLDDLLARVDAATGPDREIDVLIAIVTRHDWPNTDAEHVGDGIVRDLAGPYAAKPFTASVDAALALAERVLSGCMWRVGFDPDDGSMKAEIITAAPRCVSVRANHDTPALAICAAVLRAIRHDARDGAPQHNPEAQSHG